MSIDVAIADPTSTASSLAVLEAEEKRLTRLSKNSAVVRDLKVAGQVHADILRVREQIKQQKAGVR
jgi:hypothetical protein